jgi:exodeoxyribonuclease VII small subunit
MAREKFEEALNRLEVLVKRMEAGDMTLEGSLKAFEEGTRLARFCAKKLDDAERRVDLMLRQGDELTTSPFKDESEA